MKTSKKKPSILFLLLGAVLAGYIGYLIGGAWEQGIEMNEFINRFNKICAAPLANYYNVYTGKAIAIVIGIYGMAIVMVRPAGARFNGCKSRIRPVVGRI